MKSHTARFTLFIIWLMNSYSLIAQDRSLSLGDAISSSFTADTTHVYELQLQEGHYVELAVEESNAGVFVSVYRPDSTLIDAFDALIRRVGDPHVRFIADETGVYRIRVTADRLSWLRSGKYELRYVNRLEPVAFDALREEQRQAGAEAAAWIGEHALPLSLNADEAFSKLLPLKQALSDVKIVGLGEATHGTGEFFKVKHQLVRFLVEQIGFNVFAIEASFSACEAINDYVAGEDVDLKVALANLGYWMWNTEEVASMIEWMRDFNGSASPEKRIRFVGVDIQSNAKALEVVGDYTRRMLPELSIRVDSTLSLFRRVESSAPGELLRAARDSLNSLIAEFALREGYLVRAGLENDFDRALQHLLVLRQWTDFHEDFPLNTYKRDFHMAQNVLSVLAGDPKARIVLWAHNVHLSKDSEVLGGWPAVGYHLNKALNEAYYAVAFEFSEGTFRAFEQTAGGDFVGLNALNLSVESDHFLSRALNQTSEDSFMVDLREARNLAADWLNHSFDMHVIGGRFGTDWTTFKWMRPVNIFEDYDGLVYIRRSTPSIPLQ